MTQAHETLKALYDLDAAEVGVEEANERWEYSSVIQWSTCDMNPFDSVYLPSTLRRKPGIPWPKVMQPELWQPMNTAPMDRTAVLVLLDNSDLPLSARYEDGNWVTTWDCYRLGGLNKPRCWMSIPDFKAPCPQGECTNKSQCWEQCGDLGHREEHCVMAPESTEEAIKATLSNDPWKDAPEWATCFNTFYSKSPPFALIGEDIRTIKRPKPEPVDPYAHLKAAAADPTKQIRLRDYESWGAWYDSTQKWNFDCAPENYEIREKPPELKPIDWDELHYLLSIYWPKGHYPKAFPSPWIPWNVPGMTGVPVPDGLVIMFITGGTRIEDSEDMTNYTWEATTRFCIIGIAEGWKA